MSERLMRCMRSQRLLPCKPLMRFMLSRKLLHPARHVQQEAGDSEMLAEMLALVLRVLPSRVL